jgi:hypothetical protein
VAPTEDRSPWLHRDPFRNLLSRLVGLPFAEESDAAIGEPNYQVSEKKTPLEK